MEHVNKLIGEGSLNREKILSMMDSEITRLCKTYDLSIDINDNPELIQTTYAIHHPQSDLVYRIGFYKEQIIGLRGIDKEIYVYNKLLEGILNVIHDLGLDRENYTPYNGDL